MKGTRSNDEKRWVRRRKHSFQQFKSPIYIPYQVKQTAGDRGITAGNMEKSQHTDFNEDTTNESASVACSNIRLWKLDSQKE